MGRRYYVPVADVRRLLPRPASPKARAATRKAIGRGSERDVLILIGEAEGAPGIHLRPAVKETRIALRKRSCIMNPSYGSPQSISRSSYHWFVDPRARQSLPW